MPFSPTTLTPAPKSSQVFGVLEWDPDAGPGGQVAHRRFLSEAVKFKQVVPIANPEVSSGLFIRGLEVDGARAG